MKRDDDQPDPAWRLATLLVCAVMALALPFPWVTVEYWVRDPDFRGNFSQHSRTVSGLSPTFPPATLLAILVVAATHARLLISPVSGVPKAILLAGAGALSLVGVWFAMDSDRVLKEISLASPGQRHIASWVFVLAWLTCSSFMLVSCRWGNR